MVTLPLLLDEDLDATLETLSSQQGRNKADIAVEALRKFLLTNQQTEQRRRALQDPTLIALYQQLAEEDVALAEAGLADYVQGLEETDRA